MSTKEDKPETKKEKISRIKKFNLELRKSVVTAIMAAFGFLIALVWRDAITEYVNWITSTSPVKGTLVTAIIVTIICVMGIIIVSRFVVEETS